MRAGSRCPEARGSDTRAWVTPCAAPGEPEKPRTLCGSAKATAGRATTGQGGGSALTWWLGGLRGICGSGPRSYLMKAAARWVANTDRPSES